MALRIRFQHASGATLGYSIERLADGLFYDQADSTFRASPATPIAALPEDTGIYVGRYKLTLSPTLVGQFSDGDYVVAVHNTAAANLVVAQLAVVMHAGDDASVVTLAASGVDAVMVEAGVNLRQAIAECSAALAGNASGAGTGTVVYKGINTSTTRITSAATNGNRINTLNLPA